jgi:hypothetical protein
MGSCQHGEFVEVGEYSVLLLICMALLYTHLESTISRAKPLYVFSAHDFLH